MNHAALIFVSLYILLTNLCTLTFMPLFQPFDSEYIFWNINDLYHGIRKLKVLEKLQVSIALWAKFTTNPATKKTLVVTMLKGNRVMIKKLFNKKIRLIFMRNNFNVNNVAIFIRSTNFTDKHFLKKGKAINIVPIPVWLCSSKIIKPLLILVNILIRLRKAIQPTRLTLMHALSFQYKLLF
jgi:hypothetical protein